MHKILIADNKQRNVEIIISYLNDSAEKYEILQADNGEIVCKIAQKELPELIILDWEIPLLSGLEVLHFLKNQAETQDIPIIVLSEKNHSPKQLAEVLNAGAVDLIHAPIDKTELLARVNMAFKISDYYKKIKEITREQDDLMSIVAHDLKSPLNKVLGLVQLMPMVGELNEEQKSYVNLMNKIIEGGRRLIDDILTINAYSYLEPLNLQTINLNQFLENLLVSYQQQAAKKQIKIYFNPDKTIELNTDEDCLSRILDNLLSNAIKFTYPEKNIYVSAKQLQDRILISVKDEGQGINQEDKKLMFKKFQRLSAKPTAGENSTGLGLSIIKVLIQKLNGEISFESEINKGTTFTVAFPLS